MSEEREKLVIDLRSEDDFSKETYPQAKNIYWENVTDVSQLDSAYDRALNDPEAIRKRQWIIDNYDPYFDGKVCQRMLEGAQDYINRHGVPERRHLNLWRKYTSIKTFGRIRRH